MFVIDNKWTGRRNFYIYTLYAVGQNNRGAKFKLWIDDSIDLKRKKKKKEEERKQKRKFYELKEPKKREATGEERAKK